jgi:ribokinase
MDRGRGRAVAVPAVQGRGGGHDRRGRLLRGLAGRGARRRDDAGQALRYAAAAAAIQVTRPGTSAGAMPDRGEVEALLARTDLEQKYIINLVAPQ